MKKEIWKIIFDNAVNKVGGIDESSKEKLVKSIIKDALIDLPVSVAKKELDLNSNESKQIEGVITQEIAKSLQFQKGFAQNEDWYRKVSIDVRRVLSSEPWWITKKDED